MSVMDVGSNCEWDLWILKIGVFLKCDTKKNEDFLNNNNNNNLPKNLFVRDEEGKKKGF